MEEEKIITIKTEQEINFYIVAEFLKEKKLKCKKVIIHVAGVDLSITLLKNESK